MADSLLPFRGSLFTQDFLTDAVLATPDYGAVADEGEAAIEAGLIALFQRLPRDRAPNESQTEDDLIWPALALLGWQASLRQQNLSVSGRDDVPDGLLFEDERAKAAANAEAQEWKRYRHGLAIVESKRWGRPLDRRSGRRGEELAPSTQMLRYLRRVDDLSSGRLRWGILTNGRYWRLYYQGARSVSENFLEIDLMAVLGLSDGSEDAEFLPVESRRHWLRVFRLAFGCRSFLPTPTDDRTFHQRALEEGRFYEERVARNISDRVFRVIFPDLAKAIAAAAPEASLDAVREAALILLYRLLFLLYAEDRDLLPVRDPRYDDYGLRGKVRGDIGARKDRGDVFSASAARYWAVIADLSRAIDEGDASIGLPPYNGGLFDPERTPLLDGIRLPDTVMADVIDALSFELADGRRKYINYRDLSVQQLGSIYERLLEFEIARAPDGTVIVRPNLFARKSSGSYYTPEELVGLIIAETLGPLIEERLAGFRVKAEALAKDRRPEDRRLGMLKQIDPAEEILKLRICDPAMGSGHFLVSLVDFLADQVIAAMAEASNAVTFGDYVSPLAERIETIRNTILGNAEDKDWTLDPAQLDDRHIIRRMVLKRCVYGVDKNPMAVELAKVALWLHTFTVGAPLSFLDHHLQAGDSLFGSRVRPVMDWAVAKGGLFQHQSVQAARSAAAQMQMIEGLTDAEIAEAHRSAELYIGVRIMTAPLDAFLTLVHALDWLDLKDRAERTAVREWLDGQFGDPVAVALGKAQPPEDSVFADILGRARALIIEERFLNWQVAFPGVWRNWESVTPEGGFDAVIGNPPWDRIKLQEIEWFAARRRDIAMAQRASDRKKLIAALERDGDPLHADYRKAAARAEATSRMARKGGDYPLLSGGDINLYSLFVERAHGLVKADGMIGLLTPSGIASDKTAAPFFKGVATTGRLKALYDFENRRTRYGETPFFPDVDSRFKFCALIAGGSTRRFEASRCAFFLQDISELDDPERCFPLAAEDFARVNPNTGTAPIFRSRRDAALTAAIYRRLPVLVDRSSGAEVRTWPVRYATMFHMANDSHLFRTREELEEQERAWPVGGNRWRSKDGEWVPLYVGRMIHQFDHRASSVRSNNENLFNTSTSKKNTIDLKNNPEFIPEPKYFVLKDNIKFHDKLLWTISFRDIARTTDSRTIIACISPFSGYGHKLPLLFYSTINKYIKYADFIVSNLNSIIFDYIARQKIQSANITWYSLEQLPVVPPETYEQVRFGPRTAGEIVRAAVLELSYTAHDIAAFARDMGHVDEAGDVLPPFPWDEARRTMLRAKLDALYFLLYGVGDRDDVRHIFSTFPIIERQERAAHGRYLSRDLCLCWMNALEAGAPDAEIALV